MSELLVLEFSGVGEADYKQVNAELGIDASTGKGDWPAGLVTHLAGAADGDRIVVVETWASRDAQTAFMHDRLGPALGRAGVTAQPKVTWATVVGEQHPGR
jgi:hypothetical protein